MHLSWDKELETGSERIDTQHRELFKRVNMLLDAIHNGKGKKEVFWTLEFLSTYVILHFYDEEALMIEYTYNGFETHRREHIQFKKEYHMLEKMFQDTGITRDLLFQTQQRICDWLKNHIQEEDKKLAHFIRNIDI
ncbi:MAG: bacteriohemerythrin [Candidatus Brocadiaceae bacterium]|nr:bacteriohemerythrin [Candidatus Brocadiaceae bacterium]